MMCLACAMKRKVKLDPKVMVIAKCKDCGETRVCGEAKV